jgi:hypothetical protein
MDAETLEALRGSIAKWHAIAFEGGEDNGYKNCPLCEKFMNDESRFCDGCPVATATGERGCRNTPYDAWSRADDTGFADTPEKVALAVAELDFLKSLLPAEATP